MINRPWTEDDLSQDKGRDTPEQVRIGPYSVAWRELEISKWMADPNPNR
ncbi:AlpA family phage regulatory protein [Pseudomonas sp. JUb42]|nr:AlpA family phage regulatory protein [Pseudomonas sp. JUb42]